MDPELAQIVDLRLRLCASPPPSRVGAEALLGRVFGGLLSSASAVERLEADDRLAGVLLVAAPQPNRFGAPESTVSALLDPAVPAAPAWAAQRFESLVGALPAHCSLDLRPQDQALAERARIHGFGVSKLDLVGDVETARTRLRDRVGRARADGVQFSPLTAALAEPVSRMVGAFFRENADLGWGGSPLTEPEQAVIDAREAAGMRDRLAAGPLTDYVVRRGGALVGHMSCVFHPEHGLYGASGGMNLFLAPEVQGLGLGAFAYAHLLARLSELGAKTFFGRTSNPAVIHIGRYLGRRLERLIMRRDGPFLSADAGAGWSNSG